MKIFIRNFKYSFRGRSHVGRKEGLSFHYDLYRTNADLYGFALQCNMWIILKGSKRSLNIINVLFYASFLFNSISNLTFQTVQ
jgi:hypothetical protein